MSSGQLQRLLLLLMQLDLWPASGQMTGDGCGHSVLAPYSGTLTSKNYPGTYPNFTSCEWRIHVATGSHLSLVFGDMDIEASEECKSGFLLLSSPSDSFSYGPYCSSSGPPHTVLVVNSSSVTISFSSTVHRSGRGFLLSYASGNHSDLISCLQKGIHYSKGEIKAYCPAGCKGVPGEIWGSTRQGYRDTSVLCKAAVHAGVILDERGGYVTVSREKGITLYESTFANGLYSKTGPLSEKRLIFHKACANVLEVTSFNASSYWQEESVLGERLAWAAEQAAFSAAGGTCWVADERSAKEWLEVDLGRRRNITGIITKGSSHKHDYYVKSYQVLSSRDGKVWEAYKSNGDHEPKVFEGNRDSRQEVSNAFIPPIAARYLRIAPLSWNQRVALKVALLGCQSTRPKALHPYSNNQNLSGHKEQPVPTSSSPLFSPVPGIVISSEKTGPPLLVMLLIGGFVLVSSALVLLVFLCHKKRKTAAEQDCGLVKGYPASDASQACSRGSLPLSASEMGSFPGARTPIDLSGAQSPECCQGRRHADLQWQSVPKARDGSGDLPSVCFQPSQSTEYAEPDVVQVSPSSQTAPSTFKPALDEGYTLPLVVNHYDVPGKRHEYTEPLPPEPEYAMPFAEQPPEPEGGACRKNICAIRVLPSPQSHPGSLAAAGCLEPQTQYDFPAQRPTAEPDNTAGETGLLEGSVEMGTLYREPQGPRTLSPRDEGPAAQPAASPHSSCFQPKDSTLAHVYHEAW